jgi:hypothetical protein
MEEEHGDKECVDRRKSFVSDDGSHRSRQSDNTIHASNQSPARTVGSLESMVGRQWEVFLCRCDLAGFIDLTIGYHGLESQGPTVHYSSR